jgi:hypothetical protein
MRQKNYPEELISLAKENGYKAANLDFLDSILLEFNEQSKASIAIEVPKHISISNKNIVAHLNNHASLWQEKWQEFCQLQGDLNDNLEPTAIIKLKEIQEIIHAAFSS